MSGTRRRSIALGVALMVLPTVLAILLLTVALLGSSLVLVLISIVLSLAALPAFVGGVVVLVRSSRG
jgi:hypothetical protein